jgi:hypothetical protein
VNVMNLKRNNKAIILVVTLVGLLHGAGCSREDSLPQPSPAQMAEGRRRPSSQAKRTVDQIARDTFGPTFRNVTNTGGTAALTFAPKQEGTPAENLRRIVARSSQAIPAVFGSDPKVQVVRITAVDAALSERRLLVFSLTREASGRIDWQRHGSVKNILGVAKVEYQDPVFGSRTGRKG